MSDGSNINPRRISKIGDEKKNNLQPSHDPERREVSLYTYH